MVIVNTKLKHCNLVFSQSPSHLARYINIMSFYFARPGYTDVKVNQDQLVQILNGVIESRVLLNNDDTVCATTKMIESQDDEYNVPEIHLLTTKVNDDVKISLLGFRKHQDKVPEKLYEIQFDKDDDIYHICAEYLRFINECKISKLGLKWL